jgi:hypothetical protein
MNAHPMIDIAHMIARVSSCVGAEQRRRKEAALFSPTFSCVRRRLRFCRCWHLGLMSAPINGPGCTTTLLSTFTAYYSCAVAASWTAAVAGCSPSRQGRRLSSPPTTPQGGGGVSSLPPRSDGETARRSWKRQIPAAAAVDSLVFYSRVLPKNNRKLFSAIISALGECCCHRVVRRKNFLSWLSNGYFFSRRSLYNSGISISLLQHF